MDRFVALLWDDRSTLLARRASGLADSLLKKGSAWTSALDAPGLKLFVRQKPTGKRFVTPMISRSGAVIGPLFRRGDEANGRVTQLADVDASKIVSTRGASLLHDFWGSYVALWRSDEGTCEALRDPSGALPCLRTNSAGIEILCSFVADIASLPGVHFSIDRAFLAAFLGGNTAVTQRTGLAELSEVLPGERMTLRRSRAPFTEWAWRAPDIASRPKLRTMEEAALEAREIAERCFTAWGRLSDNVVVRLSGGLDSSVVAALLRRHSTGRVTALHIVGKGYESRELTFARQAAKFADVELLEIDGGLQPTDYAPLLANEVALPRPSRQIFGATADNLLADVYAALSADTAASGHGGDVIFFQRSMSGAISADDLRLNGPVSGFWRRLYDSATLLERSVWGTAADAFSANRRRKSGGLARSPHAPSGGLAALLDLDLDLIPETYLQHPLASLTSELPPAKALHVRGLHALRDYHAQRVGASLVDDIHPLMAQPIAEFALATPAYLFGAGGMDRSLERHAFRNLLPEAVFHRTSKGFVNHELSSLFQQNLPYFRELVLQGDLIRLFSMDRAQLETLLAPENLQRDAGLDEVMTLVAAEFWLSTWSRLATRSADDN